MRFATLVWSVLAIGLAGATPAAAAPPLGPDGTTAPVRDYAQAVRERVVIPQPGIDQDANGVPDKITIDIIRPAGTGPSDQVPAIIDPSPYYTTSCKGLDDECIEDTNADGIPDTFPLWIDNFFVPRGYAYILAQANGTGYTSDGCPQHGGPGDIAGMKSVIDWLNGRTPGTTPQGAARVASWHNGSSAMIGKSYDGTLANGVAATGVSGLKTIVPIAAISDWYAYSRSDGVRTVGTNYPQSLNQAITWTTRSQSLGLPDRRPTCAPINTAINNLDGDETGDRNAWWDARSYLPGAANVDAAVFAVHGFQDDNVKMSQLWPWWNALPASTPRKLWLLRSGHTDPFDARRDAWISTMHRWFDHWLYGIDNGVMDEPAVTIEDEKDVWNEYASWPVPGTADVPVFLQGTDGGAAGALRGVSGGPVDTAAFTNTSQGSGATIPASVETNAMNTPNGAQTNRRVFLSRPLTRDVRLSGRAVLELQASLNATQSNLGVIVVDYGPAPFSQVSRSSDGTTTVSSTTCIGPAAAPERNCWREVTKPVQTVSQWRVTRGILDSSNRGSLHTATPLTIGQPTAFTIAAEPTEHIFAAGHQIGVVVVGNLLGTAGTPGAQITVDTKLSRIQLPIAGGAAAARAAGLTDEAAPVTTTDAPTGWTTARQVALVADDADGAGVASITYRTTGAPETVAGPAAAVPVTNDGSTTVHYFATDKAGNAEAEKSVTIQRDTTAPVVSCAGGDDQWHADNVAVACTAGDAGSGLVDSAAFALATTVAAGSEDASAPVVARSICDGVHNCATAGGGSRHMVDRKGPEVTLTVPRALVFARGERVTARYACSDGGSGMGTCAPAAGIDTLRAGAGVLRAAAADALGNPASAQWSYTVLGKLPKLGVRKRGAMKLVLTSRVRATVKLTGTLKRGSAKVALRSQTISLQPGVARTVTVRAARTLRGATAQVALATTAGLLKRADAFRWRP